MILTSQNPDASKEEIHEQLEIVKKSSILTKTLLALERTNKSLKVESEQIGLRKMSEDVKK